jgi:hypothetical protein
MTISSPKVSDRHRPKSPRGLFFFVRDFDGNLIELMDLGFMYHVLNWGGPLAVAVPPRMQAMHLPSPPR